MTNEEKNILRDMCAASHDLHGIMRPELTDMRTAIRTFDTGATRSPAEGKPEYAGYMTPEVVQAFGAYMLKHQTQSDGNKRDSRNWQKGIPLESYMQSIMRHFVEVWAKYEDYRRHGYTMATEETIDSLMALKFNVDGMAFEVLRGDDK